MSFKALILCFLLFLSGIIPAQTTFFKNYSVEHGLPFIQVQTLFQDSKGYLWSGGYGGLSRFDGNTFLNFSTRNGLVNHSVTAINEDKEGNLWIGTINGLSFYDGKNFKSYSKEDGLLDNQITYLLTDTSGVWIGTTMGINHFDGKKFTPYTTKTAGLFSNTVFVAYQAKNGKYWLGSLNGLMSYDNSGIKGFRISSDKEENAIYAIVEGPEGEIYSGTGKGLFIFNPNKNAFVKVSALGEERVYSLVKDRQGIVWVATSGGLFKIYEGQVRRYEPAPDLNSNIVTSLIIDYEGNLWAGTYNGLYRYRDDMFVTYDQRSGLQSSFVFQSTRGYDGNLWIGTTNGLHIFDGQNFRVLTERDGLPGNAALSCFNDDGKSMWIGTDKGLCIYSKKLTRSYTRKDGLVSDSVSCIFRDSKGNMLIGGMNGISTFDGKKFTPHKIESKMSSSFSIWKIVEVGPESYVIGTYQGGIISYDHGKFSVLNDSLGIKENVVLDVVKDEDGFLYFATLDGVYMYDRDKKKKANALVHFNQDNGMSSDLVYCIGLDKDSRYLWAGTNQGVNRIDISTFKRTGRKKIDIFGKEDGFLGVESNSNGILVDPDGSIWFGTINGLVHYNERNYIPNSYEPKVNLTGFNLFYKDTLLADNTKFSYDNNNLTFRYSATSLTNPEKVRYKIMLAGFDKDWSPVTSSTKATYSNLPPGKYTFKVIASNNEGIWSSKPAMISFSIEKAWWNTWLFRGAIFCFILSVFFAWFQIRSQQITRREREKAKRNLEIAKLELKALRSQMNPHFIFNSLNSIQHFILHSEEASAVKYLNKFARLIRIILNNSEKPVITLREEIEALQLYIELEELRFSDKFSYKIIVDESIDIDYFEVPPLILQPYVENAILHGLNPRSHRGNLEISIRKDDNYIVCSVIDDGIGRKRAMEMRGEILRKPHISHGTRITRERLEILNKSLHSDLSVNITDLDSDNGKATGTKVEVFIPV